MSNYIEVYSREELLELLQRDPTIKHIRIMFENLSDLYSNTLSHIDPDFKTIDLTCWDVSRVRDMRFMFYHAIEFNQDLSNWDTRNVECMSWMFCNAKSFNQDIGGWNVSKVEDMSWMFKDAKSFNHDLSSWDLSSVQYTRFMFDDCELKIPPRNYKLLEEYYSE